MSPAVLLTFLVAGLLALLPVWRLHRAGWPTSWLACAWIVYALGIFIGVRFPGPFRLLLPILILLYVAPFVAGPERLARVLGGRRPERGVIIDVTPRPAPALRDRHPTTPPGAEQGGDDGTDDGTEAAGDQERPNLG